MLTYDSGPNHGIFQGGNYCIADTFSRVFLQLHQVNAGMVP